MSILLKKRRHKWGATLSKITKFQRSTHRPNPDVSFTLIKFCVCTCPETPVKIDHHIEIYRSNLDVSISPITFAWSCFRDSTDNIWSRNAFVRSENAFFMAKNPLKVKPPSKRIFWTWPRNSYVKVLVFWFQYIFNRSPSHSQSDQEVGQWIRRSL